MTLYMISKKILFLLCTLLPSLCNAQTKTLFDSDWRFSLGDDSLASQVKYDDSRWRRLTLPHDWSIEQPFDRNAPAGGDGGYLPCGTGWYRKAFAIPATDKGRQLWLFFEGVYMNSSVYVNGHLAGGHPYGYSSFFVDITGYNYMIHKSESDHERVPERVMWQTESYPRDAYMCWAKVEDNPYIIGDFVWTAIDYVGESSIGLWHYDGENQGEHYQGDHYPWHGAYCGDIDLTGWRKPISHYREILWNENMKTPLYMAVKEPQGYYGKFRETSWSVWPTWESWNWKGHEGKPIEVEVYSRYPKVRLYINDDLAGELPTTRAQEFKAVFKVNYQPGTLRIVGVRPDETEDKASEQTIKTSGAPAQLTLTPSAPALTADGQDVMWVNVDVLDASGVPVPDAETPLTFSVTGPAQILATANASLRDETPYTSTSRKAWKGRAIVALRSTGKKGNVTLKVKGEGVKSQSLVIKTR